MDTSSVHLIITVDFFSLHVGHIQLVAEHFLSEVSIKCKSDNKTLAKDGKLETFKLTELLISSSKFVKYHITRICSKCI